jgi:anti-sigma factor RsiW
MAEESQSGMQCTEFDALLSEAIDGTLAGRRRARLDRHRAACEECARLFDEVSSGAAWLQQMEEVAPPPRLVQGILAATSAAVPQPRQAPRTERRAWPGIRSSMAALFAPVLTPRFGLSMGMAFFSITLVLNMAQIRIRELTPHRLSHMFYSRENKAMKYYENMPLVVKIESQVRELRNASSGNEREEQNSPRREL